MENAEAHEAREALPDGVLLIDKPEGMTSFDVLRVLRQLFVAQKEGHARTLTLSLPKRGSREEQHISVNMFSKLAEYFDDYIERHPSTTKLVCGHAGTLDPMATGLLIVGVGEGTKKLSELVKLPKTYEAEVLFGVRTDTGDVTGEVLERVSVSGVRRSALEKVLRDLEGVIELPVPLYSAVKQSGEALYKKARRGERVAPPRRKIIVQRAELKDLARGYKDNPDAWVAYIHFDVGSGTYIRSLAEDIGRRMNMPATLSALRRTQIGGFRIEDAKKLENFE